MAKGKAVKAAKVVERKVTFVYTIEATAVVKEGWKAPEGFMGDAPFVNEKQVATYLKGCTPYADIYADDVKVKMGKWIKKEGK